MAIIRATSDGNYGSSGTSLVTRAETLSLGTSGAYLSYPGISVPEDAELTSAYLRFTAASSQSGMSSVEIKGLSGNGPAEVFKEGYSVGDLVYVGWDEDGNSIEDSVVYQCIQSHTTSQYPPTETGYWEVFVNRLNEYGEESDWYWESRVAYIQGDVKYAESYTFPVWYVCIAGHTERYPPDQPNFWEPIPMWAGRRHYIPGTRIEVDGVAYLCILDNPDGIVPLDSGWETYWRLDTTTAHLYTYFDDFDFISNDWLCGGVFSLGGYLCPTADGYAMLQYALTGDFDMVVRFRYTLSVLQLITEPYLDPLNAVVCVVSTDGDAGIAAYQRTISSDVMNYAKGLAANMPTTFTKDAVAFLNQQGTVTVYSLVRIARVGSVVKVYGKIEGYTDWKEYESYNMPGDVIVYIAMHRYMETQEYPVTLFNKRVLPSRQYISNKFPVSAGKLWIKGNSTAATFSKFIDVPRNGTIQLMLNSAAKYYAGAFVEGSAVTYGAEVVEETSGSTGGGTITHTTTTTTTTYGPLFKKNERCYVQLTYIYPNIYPNDYYSRYLYLCSLKDTTALPGQTGLHPGHPEEDEDWYAILPAEGAWDSTFNYIPGDRVYHKSRLQRLGYYEEVIDRWYVCIKAHTNKGILLSQYWKQETGVYDWNNNINYPLGSKAYFNKYLYVKNRVGSGGSGWDKAPLFRCDITLGAVAGKVVAYRNGVIVQPEATTTVATTTWEEATTSGTSGTSCGLSVVYSGELGVEIAVTESPSWECMVDIFYRIDSGNWVALVTVEHDVSDTEDDEANIEITASTITEGFGIGADYISISSDVPLEFFELANMFGGG